MAKNGTHAVAAPAKKKEKVRKTFTQLLHFRIDRAEKLLKGIGRQLIRAGQGVEHAKTSHTALNSIRTQVAELPADFQPARAPAGTQPMQTGTVVELVAARREDAGKLLGVEAAAGKWEVVVAEQHRVGVKSQVTGEKAFFARRDVQLPGMERQVKTDAERAAAKAKRVAKKLAQGAQA